MVLLFAAGDVYGQRLNLQLEFPSLPTLAELFSAIQNVFANECAALRPGDRALQRFELERVQLFSEKDEASASGWKDLISSSQIADNAQLFVFQRDPTVASETRQRISKHLSRRPSPRVESLCTTPPQGVPRDTANPSFSSSGLVGGTAGHLVELSPIRFKHTSSAQPHSAEYTPLASPDAPAAHTSSLLHLQNHTTTSAISSQSNAALSSSVFSPASYRSRAPQSPRLDVAVLGDKARCVYDYLCERQDTANTGGSVLQVSDVTRCVVELHLMDSAASLQSSFGEVFGSSPSSHVPKETFVAAMTKLPVLLNSLHRCLSDARAVVSLQDDIHRKAHLLDELRSSVMLAQNQLDGITRKLQGCQARADSLKGNFDAMLHHSAVLDSRSAEARQAVDAAVQQKASAQNDTASKKAFADRAGEAVAESARQVEQAVALQRQQETKLEAYQGRVAELQRQLQIAQEEAQRQSDVVAAAKRNVAVLSSRSSEQRQQADTSVAAWRSACARLEDSLRVIEERREQVLAMASQKQKFDSEASAVQTSLLEANKELAELHDAQLSQLQQVEAMQSQLRAQARGLAESEARLLAIQQESLAQEQDVRPLIEQELQLRSRRAALEAQENEHVQRVGELFSASHGRIA